MPSQILRIATRRSPLALRQAEQVRELLLHHWPDLRVELIPLITSGDKLLTHQLALVGGKGLFVKELEEALLNHKADIAVHSTKDMPAELPAGLSLSAVCKRDNPFDALISPNYPSLEALPAQAVVGTASLRRQAQLLAFRSDLQTKVLRGNVNTRLNKLNNKEYDALILAAAGLERLGLQEHLTQVLSPELMLPACGQGALCIESRTGDEAIEPYLRGLNDPLSALCVHTERRVNAQLGGSCQVPLAIFCTPISTQQLSLRAKILIPDGSQWIEDKQIGTLDEAQTLADRCVASLKRKGAATLLQIPLP